MRPLVSTKIASLVTFEGSTRSGATFLKEKVRAEVDPFKVNPHDRGLGAVILATVATVHPDRGVSRAVSLSDQCGCPPVPG